MAISDIYQLTLNQTIYGRDIQNAFFYEREEPTGTAADVAEQFVTNILPTILAIQSAAVLNVNLVAINLGDLADFETVPLTGGGTYGDVDTMPAFNAVGYSLRLNTRAVRPGSKRFAGVPEEASLNGELVLPAYLTRVETLRTVLDDPIGATLGLYNPIVVKRIKEPVVGTVPPKFTYRLPTVGDPVTVGVVVSALVGRQVTSQTSRKD